MADPPDPLRADQPTVLRPVPASVAEVAQRLARGTGPQVASNTVRMRSDIIYKFLPLSEKEGQPRVPHLLGEGRFAKVYKAWQNSDGQNIRPVAIKILHNTGRYSDQHLLEQEIDLLKELSIASTANIVRILDVIQMEPLIMCGCGQVYHPLCPQCGRHPLERRDLNKKESPSLACPDSRCGYEVSAADIERQYKRLTSPPTKNCCREGPYVQEGTIINFVDRPAVVMELEETRLDQVAEARLHYFDTRCQEFVASSTGSSERSSMKINKLLDDVRLQRAMALDKMMLMVQIAEAVFWLHHEMRIVHKDLTPDNVMVNFMSTKGRQGPLKRKKPLKLQELLDDLVSYPRFGVKIIDFGLADREQLSRKWYEDKDMSNAGMDKAPYFSLEAKQRSQTIQRLTIDIEQKRFLIPKEQKDSVNSVHEGDILTFQWDLQHQHDLVIQKIEPALERGRYYAYFEGQPPPAEQQRQIQMVLPLGEAHDIYSVGALFYFIMTGNHLKVNDLSGFVNVLQRQRCELTAREILRDHGHTYLDHKSAIPIPNPFWQDRVMELILRAMVRGRNLSFNDSRSQRGSAAAHELLWATKRIYHGFQQEVLGEVRVKSLRRLTVGAATLAVLLSGAAAYMIGGQRSLYRQQQSQHVEKPAPPVAATVEPEKIHASQTDTSSSEASGDTKNPKRGKTTPRRH